MSVNIWAQVGATSYELVMEALYGTSNQLLGMNTGATALQYKDATFNNTTGQLAVPVGSAAAPSYSVTGDLDTGIYFGGTNTLGITVGGTVRALFSTSSLTASVNLVMSGKLIEEDMGADIAAAATTDLGTATGNYLTITNAAGTTTITSLGGATLPAGTMIETKFSITGGSVSITHNATSLRLLGSADIANVANGTIMRWRKVNDNSAYWDQVSSTSALVIDETPSQKDLLFLLHADAKTGHRDLIQAGLLPAFFNQQWGGAPHYYEMVDSATSTPYTFESATGYIDDSGNTGGVAIGASTTWQAQGFKVSQTGTISAIWVKMRKVGNPTNNCELRILPDDGTGKPSGSTAITNGTATAVSGKLFSSDTNGQWVRFAFPTPPTLTAGTQYHYALKSSGAVDASNYWVVNEKGAKKYPHGANSEGDATPTWTAYSTTTHVFLVEASSSLASLQTGGIFSDGKLTFFEGSPLNQSNGRCANLKDIQGLNLSSFSIFLAGENWTKDKTILDITYGMDHDRIVLRCAATTGYPVLTVCDSSGNARTVTGTVDISSGQTAIGIVVSANNNSSTDTVKLIVNGASNGTPVTGVAIAFDELFKNAQIGTLWLGGGFALAPTWSGSSISTFSALPSSLGWTYGGAATESSAFSVSGGKLYQNYGGFTALQDGYYKKTTAGLSNANGWAVVPKVRVARSTNTKTSGTCGVTAHDGTKGSYGFLLQEYFAELWQSTVGSVSLPQTDMKSADVVLCLIGKGSDAFAFANGRLLHDGTGLLVTASATNEIQIGDGTTASGEHADVVHSYWKYYSTAWLPPQFTSGSLSEFAIWNGDKTTLISSLYAAGTIVSVKQFCGLGKNCIGDGVVQRYTLGGVTSGSTTTSTTNAAIDEMSCFAVGGLVSAQLNVGCGNNVAGSTSYTWLTLDGILGSLLGDKAIDVFMQDSASYIRFTHAQLPGKRVQFGLHKLEGRWGVSGNTLTAYNTFRSLGVEARA